MKLYAWDSAAQQKFSLNLLASTRGELAGLIGSQWFTINGRNFHVNHVYAEADTSSTGAGAVVGGLIGLLAGPVGILVGSLFGGAIGSESDKAEIQKVNYFNNSRV